MKTTREDGGDTTPADLHDELPGGLGKPIERTKPWGPLDERRKRRELQERAARPVVDGYRTWVGPDGKLITEKVGA